MKWLVRLVIAACLGAWVAFFASGCVEVPGPIDGQVYRCTIGSDSSREVIVVERCGPWDDWKPVADELAVEHPNTNIDCRGTRRACAREP